METIKIGNKEYVMVNERLKAFRAQHKDYSLISDVISLDNESCVIKATILDENGRVLATGLAQEDRSSTKVNQTSYVENCETSAWGRALANFGYGIDTAVASADEVAMAVGKQGIKEEVIGGDFVMPNGKHKGMPIAMIPDDYVDWYLENGYDNNVKANMRKYRKDIYIEEHPDFVEVSQTSGNSFKGE